MARKTHPPYSPDFRAEAVQLACTSGLPLAPVARDLGVNPETLRLGVKQADIDAGRRAGLTTRATSPSRRVCVERSCANLTPSP